MAPSAVFVLTARVSATACHALIARGRHGLVQTAGDDDFLLKVCRGKRIHSWHRLQPVFGKPSFVLPKLRVAVFVDGCFWHGCPLHATKPRNNAAFWRRKLAGNRARDRLVNRTLRESGWRVLRIWEHELTRRREARLVRRLRRVSGY